MKGYFILKIQSYTNCILYEQHIKTLGMERVINKTHLQEKFLNSFLRPNNNESDGKFKVLIFEHGMHSKLPKIIFKVRHCCLLRLQRYCAKSLLTSKAFSLMAACITSRCQQESVPSILKTFFSIYATK